MSYTNTPTLTPPTYPPLLINTTPLLSNPARRLLAWWVGVEMAAMYLCRDRGVWAGVMTMIGGKV